jgi:hypothetical protein
MFKNEIKKKNQFKKSKKKTIKRTRIKLDRKKTQGG